MKLSQRKRRLIQFWCLQETVLFLISHNCAFILLERELYSYCKENLKKKMVDGDFKLSFLKNIFY